MPQQLNTSCYLRFLQSATAIQPVTASIALVRVLTNRNTRFPMDQFIPVSRKDDAFGNDKFAQQQ